MCGSTRRAPDKQTAADGRHEALFASELQPSDTPTEEVITSAIAASVLRFGSRGIAERMAQEFGDHPDVAADRMRWACTVAA